MRKSEIYEGTIEKVLFPNKGYATVEDPDVDSSVRVIVKNGIPGQKIQYRICKKKHGQFEGQLLTVLQKSDLETVDKGCSNFPNCGGCMYRTMPYEEQLNMKADQVRHLIDQAMLEGGQVRYEAVQDRNVEDTAGIDRNTAVIEERKIDSTDSEEQKLVSKERIVTPDYIYEGIKASPDNDAYRNKMEYSFGDSEKDGPLMLGLHKKASTYDILPATDCRIVHEDINQIVACVLDFCREQGWSYLHKMSHVGYLRHLLVRRAVITGEILVDLVTSSQFEMDLSEGNPRKHLTEEEMHPVRTADSLTEEHEKLMGLARRLQQLPLEGTFAGILHTTNDALADIIRNDQTEILCGQDYFYENIMGLTFKITPFSFFQTNSKGAEVLYKTAREFLGDIENQTVFDLYSGTGTIAQMMAPVAKKVIGVEIVEEAVEAAKENAKRNHLDNCEFIAGDVLKVIDSIKEKPDSIVLDPPRDGIHPKALPKIIAFGVEKIIYISCKPSSLARDLPEFLKNGYRMERICSVDMFPHTTGIETVCLLSKKA